MRLTRFFLTATLLTALSHAAVDSARPRNIVIIYADDLGYGDLSCYGAHRVSTPNVDRLAREGLRFTSAHTTSATCTPSRFALLSGEYPWRRDGTGVLPGDAALVIDTQRATLPAILQRAGYATAAVGKWHLGLGAPNQAIDWNQPIAPGPREVGFDTSFIMAATADRVPCVYVENQRVVGLDPADPLRVSYKVPFPSEPTGVTDRAKLKLNWSHGHNMAVVNGMAASVILPVGARPSGSMKTWPTRSRARPWTSLTARKTGPFSSTSLRTIFMCRASRIRGSSVALRWVRAEMPSCNWIGRSAKSSPSSSATALRAIR